MSVERGGHFAPGIGDYAYTELGSPTNESIIARGAAIAKAVGRELASPGDVREMLDLPGR